MSFVDGSQRLEYSCASLSLGQPSNKLEISDGCCGALVEGIAVDYQSTWIIPVLLYHRDVVMSRSATGRLRRQTAF